MSEEINKPEEMNTNTSAESKWYVVHTYSGYENKVKANIEKTVENRGMQHLIHEVSVPLQDVVEIKDGQKKTVQRKVFPGYVLLKMIMTDETWSVSYTHLDVYKRQPWRSLGYLHTLHR